jgi:hypothetical protein
MCRMRRAPPGIPRSTQAVSAAPTVSAANRHGAVAHENGQHEHHDLRAGKRNDASVPARIDIDCLDAVQKQVEGQQYGEQRKIANAANWDLDRVEFAPHQRRERHQCERCETYHNDAGARIPISA